MDGQPYICFIKQIWSKSKDMKGIYWFVTYNGSFIFTMPFSLEESKNIREYRI